MKYINEKLKGKIGKVLFSQEMYESYFDTVRLFFNYSIILKVEFIHYRNVYEIVLLNDFFEKIDEGCEIPSYAVIFSTKNGISFSCERLT